MVRKENKSVNETSPKYLFRLVAVLTTICVLVSILLAAVNAFTKEKIEENGIATKEKSVLDIFPSGDKCELYGGTDGQEVYLVYKNEDILGYCVFVSAAGFGGEIEMMVGISSDYTTEGVSIVSMSETPGVGSKTNSDSFLGQFKNGTHTAPTAEFDAISGATISSEAVADGVRMAHNVDIDLEAAAAEKGVSLVSATEKEEYVPDETLPSEDTSDSSETIPEEPVEEMSQEEPVSEPEEEATLPADGEKYAYGEMGGDPSYRYGRYAETAKNEYRIEISREEETAEIETEEETEE